MKYFFNFALIFFFAAPIYATEQIPDFIEYEGEICELEATWQHPSPLEIYFHNSGKKYPFKVLSTANYRGHIASWKLSANTLYLTKIKVGKDVVDLNKYFPNVIASGQVKADWFNGIAWVKTGAHKENLEGGGYTIEYDSFIFFRFNEGVVTKKVVLSSEKYWNFVNEYFQRRETENPVQNGVIFEFAQYIHSFRESGEENKN